MSALPTTLLPQPTDPTTTTTTHPLSPLLTTNPHTPLSLPTLSTALSTPPFLPLPGAMNLRDLGLLPGSPIPPGLLYRSGAVNRIPVKELAGLGLSGILDLRSGGEVGRHPNADVDGVENVFGGEDEGRKGVEMVDLSSFQHDSGIPAYTAHYLSIATTHAPYFRALLRHILAHPATPLLFHCTAGKDRTGVLAALLLALAGAPDHLIAYDYALTRIGIEPYREMLTQALLAWNKEWRVDTPGMKEFAECRGEFVLGFLRGLEERYGGVEGYVREVLGLGVEEVERVKRVLRGEGV